MTSLLAALVLGAGCARAAAAPDPRTVLGASLEAPAAPYAAELLVERGGRSLRLSVLFSPPNLYRRELQDAQGRTVQTIVEDGRSEWIYDHVRRKAWQGEPADPLFKRFGPDEEEERLQQNYELALSTAEKVAGRAVWLLSLRSRADGSLSRRLWVDRARGLVLKRESFGPDGGLAGRETVTRLDWGRPAEPGRFRFIPPAGTTAVKRTEPDYLALDEAKSAGTPPRLPAWLPSGYVFESLDLMAKGKRSVLHYRFSDGIEVLSLFQCPARMRFDLGSAPRQDLKLSAGRGFRTRTAEGSVLSWSSKGERFILIGSLSDETLRRVAESIP